MELIDKQMERKALDRGRVLDWIYNGNAAGFTIGEFTFLINSGYFDLSCESLEEVAKLKDGLETVVGAHSVTMQRAIQAEKEREHLAAFIRDMIRDGCWNIDGGDLQDKAEKLGFLRAEIYDPEKHGDDFDGAPGEDEIYVFAGLLEGSKSQ